MQKRKCRADAQQLFRKNLTKSIKDDAMRKHITTLGILYIVFGLLGILVAILFINALAGRAPIPATTRFIFSTSGFGSVLAFFFGIVSVPAIVGGIALLTRRSWSRILLLILGFLNLFNIPLGTILGIYTIWVLMNDEATRILDSGAEDKFTAPNVFPPYH
jgi:uncharacterized membrane protein